MSLRSLIKTFAHELDQEEEIGNILWLNLPSYTLTEKAHGYADIQCPSSTVLMQEATAIFALLMDWPHPDIRKGSTWRRQFMCPCGNCEIPSLSAIEEILVKNGILKPENCTPEEPDPLKPEE